MTAVPAATLVIAREGETRELEVLLVRRSAHASFVPGAYVFPGGVVEPADAAPETLACVSAPPPGHAAERLGLPAAAAPPGIAYYVAAVREALEETGILIGAHAPPDCTDLLEARDALLSGRLSFVELLARLAHPLDLTRLEYIAHWITPVSERRRYDTRFFLAASPPGAEPLPDPRETTDALWVRPADAVRRATEGTLPMILPTVRTLEALAPFASAQAALVGFAGRPVPTILPPSPGERNALPTRRERAD